MKNKFRIAVFAHNEEDSIEKSIVSILQSFTTDDDFKVIVLSNGCSDKTIDIVKSLEKLHHQISLIEIGMADKCNAWNTYVYDIADDSFCHWFCDGDVTFSRGAFQFMLTKLKESDQSYAVAGVPLSGRGRKKYLDMIINDHTIFGNLYAVKTSFLKKIRQKKFKMPIGFLVDDNLIGRIIQTDIDRKNPPQKYHIAYDERAGYFVKSLSPFSIKDYQAYYQRLVRYRLGELQQKKLRSLAYDSFPDSMNDINQIIFDELTSARISIFNFIMRGVKRKLHKKCHAKLR